MLRQGLYYDPLARTWWVPFPDEDVRLKPGMPPEYAQVSGDVFSDAMAKLDARANGRLREARARIARNHKRRWRHPQPRRILA